jgi:hypothetical protein
MRPRFPAVALAALAIGVAACAGGATPSASSPSASHAPSPSASASEPAATSSPSQPVASPIPSEEPAGAVIATFLVAGEEEYRILLTDPADIAIAQRLLAGEEELATIPNGLVVRGDDGGVNTGYAWHIDPNDIEFAELTIEVCDGMPSDVERGVVSGDRFCPWSAELVSLEPAS